MKQPGAQDFLIDRLRAERFLDPDMMATLLVLRRRLIDEYGTESAADLTLIDVAVQTSPDDPLPMVAVSVAHRAAGEPLRAPPGFPWLSSVLLGGSRV